MARGSVAHRIWALYEQATVEAQREADPYQLLALSVLRRAVLDAVGHNPLDYTGTRASQQARIRTLYQQRAWSWFRQTHDAPFGFRWWCDVAGMTPPKRKGVELWQNRFIAHTKARSRGRTSI